MNRISNSKENGTGSTYGVGGRVLAASNVLLALLVEEVANRDEVDNGDVELGALVEETKTLGAGTAANEVTQGATEDAAVGLGGVASVGGLVAAGQLGLVTALGGGLVDGHVVGDGEVLVRAAGHGSDGGSEGEDNGGQRELHFD